MQKYQIPTTRVKHTTVVLFPLGKLKSEREKKNKNNADFCPIQVKHGRAECR